VLSVALSHAKKYRCIENNVAQDTLTKFGKADKTPGLQSRRIREKSKLFQKLFSGSDTRI